MFLMLDLAKPYVEKCTIYCGHWTSRACRLHTHDVKMQRLYGSGFSLFALHVLAKPCHFGVNWPTTFCEKKMGYISLPSNLNAIIGIISYYCVILKMVILHDAIKTTQNGVLVFKKKERKTVSFQKNKPKNWMKKTGGLFFSKKHFFFSTLIVFQSFLWFSLDRPIWNKSRHYQFDLVCAAHLECRFLVMKKLRITGILIYKNWCLKTPKPRWNRKTPDLVKNPQQW